MTRLKLSAAVADYDRVEALVDNTVRSERVDMTTRVLAPSEIFYRQLHDGEFDVSEMSLSSLLIASEQGWDFTALPIFPNRRLFHLSTWTTEGGPEPDRLAGTAFGLTEYQVTAAVWTRGTLANDFGLDLRKVAWSVERTEELSHGGQTGFAPPEGVTVQHMKDGDTLLAGLTRGDLDLVLPSPYTGMASRLNRTDEHTLAKLPGLRPLFRDERGEATRFVAEHGFLPVNHVVVIRTSLLQEDPSIGREIFDLFVKAKQAAYANLAKLRRGHLVLAATYLQEEAGVFGEDPYPYGFRANEAALRTLAGHMLDQGLVTRPVELEPLFDPALLDT
jgi:4,5-dihydroxyphthalate decarboxylase